MRLDFSFSPSFCEAFFCKFYHFVGKLPEPSIRIQGALSGLRPFLATGSPLKMMKNAFYFTLKALFVLQIFKLLSWLFGHVAKRFDKKD